MTDIKQGTEPWWKHRRARQVGWAAAILILVGIVDWRFQFHPYVSTDDARVSVILVRIAPQGAGGQIIVRNVSEGDRVKKGMVLVELDHRDAQAKLQQAQANFDLASRDYHRTQQLAAQKGVPERALDMARAKAADADAQLKLAQVAYDDTYLRSPIDGVVVQRLAEVGNMLERGQIALTIADIDNAWISANIEETDVGLVKTGQPVSIDIDEGGKLTGHISEVRYATAAEFSLIPAENPSGNFIKLVQRIPIKVALDPHPDQNLRVGQSAEIHIHVR